MQELANPGTFPKPCEFGHEVTADMYHGRAGAVGQRCDRTLSSRRLFLFILKDLTRRDLVLRDAM